MFTKEFNLELNRRSQRGNLDDCLRLLDMAREHIDQRGDPPTESEINKQILSHRAFVYYENAKWHEAAEEYGKLCELVSVHDPFTTWYHSMWAQMVFLDKRTEEARRIFRDVISSWIAMAKGPSEGLNLFFDYRKFKGELNESIEEEYRTHIQHIAHYFGEEVNTDEDLSEVLDKLKQIKSRESRTYGNLIIRYHDETDQQAKEKLGRDIQEFLKKVRTPYVKEQAINLSNKLVS